MANQRTYDIVLYGATGYTGGLTAEYLAHKASGEKFRWALAGRSPEKLEAVKRRLVAIDAQNEGVGIIGADSFDPASLAAMAAQAQVVITTVGPYINYGEPLVKACVDAGTDYVDLTGEPEFVDLVLDKYHAAAASKGARIVNCCGFDSIPHDLGAYFTIQRLNERLGSRAGTVPVTMEGFVKASGTFSGGTWHSAVWAMARFRQRVKHMKRRADTGPRKVGAMPAKIRRVPELGAWALPMPTIDPEIVRRTALAFDAFGPDFRYGHNLQVRRIAAAAGLTAGVGTVFTLAQFKPTRDLLLKVRDPGEGPTPEQRAKGKFTVRFLADAAGAHVSCAVSGGDPGYGETSKMLAESALCLALDRAKLPPFTGVVTPAMAMGDALIARLRAVGIRFEDKTGATVKTAV